MWKQTQRILALLNARERRSLVWLFVAMVLMGLIDVVGISSIFPFMAAVAKPDLVQSSRPLAWLYGLLGLHSVYRFVFFLGVIVLLLISASNLFSAFVTWLMLRFSHHLGHDLSVRILRGYIGKPYVFFLSRNSTTLTLNAIGEVGGLVAGVLVPGLQALSRSVVTAFILMLLLLVDPGLALIVAAVTGGAYVLVFLVVRRRLSRLGEASVESNQRRFKAATEALAGIKDVKILGYQRHFLARFTQASEVYARTQVQSSLIAALPRYALETLAFGGVLVILLYLLAVKKDIAQALPLMALYTVAGYRLMPAVQQVFSGLAQARFGLANLGWLYRDMKELRIDGPVVETLDRDSVATLPFDQELRLENVTFTYPGATAPAILDLSLVFAKNSTVGLVGSTGSGKTTLVDLILGLLEPDRGRILVDGLPLEERRIRAWQNRIGYVQQHIYLTDDTLAHNIAFGVPETQVDRERLERAARIARLDEFVTNQLPKGYDTSVGERGMRLSGGQRQRIGIARALYHDPDVLVLDEATSALDGITEDAIIEAMRSLAHQKTIILIAHRLSTVQDCDVILLLEHGRVIDQGSYQQLIERNETFRAMAKLRPARST